MSRIRYYILQILGIAGMALCSGCSVWCSVDPGCRHIEVNGKKYYQVQTDHGWQYTFQRKRTSRIQQQNGSCIQPVKVKQKKNVR